MICKRFHLLIELKKESTIMVELNLSHIYVNIQIANITSEDSMDIKTKNSSFS